jgi:single-strand selective monofunctional uracil DNA glycosylase
LRVDDALFPLKKSAAGLVRDRPPGALLEAARGLAKSIGELRFGPPVAYVYNPLDYAWAAHGLYLEKHAQGRKRVVFLGMNPGPFGMVQTGVPFGEVAAVRDWIGVSAEIRAPHRVHPKRPVEGFASRRSEVSGRRLWGLFADRFGTAEAFFEDHFVANYCPLAFVDAEGRNLTPDKLPAAETQRLFTACDEHLRRVVAALEPEWIVGIGDFAEKRARALGWGDGNKPGGQQPQPRCGRILHPSPASPAANRDWAGLATRQLVELGVWPGR